MKNLFDFLKVQTGVLTGVPIGRERLARVYARDALKIFFEPDKSAQVGKMGILLIMQLVRNVDLTVFLNSFKNFLQCVEGI